MEHSLPRGCCFDPEMTLYMRSGSKYSLGVRETHSASRFRTSARMEVTLFALVGSICVAPFANRAFGGGVVASWGAGQVAPPAGLNNVTAIACSYEHSLALQADGTV